MDKLYPALRTEIGLFIDKLYPTIRTRVSVFFIGELYPAARTEAGLFIDKLYPTVGAMPLFFGLPSGSSTLLFYPLALLF
jgi:hypothetical protein